MIESHACTLFEGSYHYGVGSLFNSLYCNGFRGVFWVGYRNGLPPWALSGVQKEGYFEFLPADGAVIRFVLLETDVHFANYKPMFMQFLLDTYLGDDNALCYFDPDVTIKIDWSFFRTWVTYGIALVEDCTSPYLPADHPIRFRWLEVADSFGYHKQRNLSRYYNSGFIGINTKSRGALDVWEEIIRASAGFGYQLEGFKTIGATSIWRAADQDHLNLMLMVTDYPLSTIGPDGMDFRPGGYVMSHAVDSPKPWNKKFVRYALKGVSPSSAEKRFWENAASPIAMYSPATVRGRQLSILVSSAIGRIIHHAP